MRAKAKKWKGAGRTFLLKQVVPKGLHFEERQKQILYIPFLPLPTPTFSSFGLEKYRRSQCSPSTRFSNST